MLSWGHLWILSVDSLGNKQVGALREMRVEIRRQLLPGRLMNSRLKRGSTISATRYHELLCRCVFVADAVSNPNQVVVPLKFENGREALTGKRCYLDQALAAQLDQALAVQLDQALAVQLGRPLPRSWGRPAPCI